MVNYQIAKHLPPLPNEKLLMTKKVIARVYENQIVIRDDQNIVHLGLRNPRQVNDWKIALGAIKRYTETGEPKRLYTTKPTPDRDSEEELQKREWNRKETIAKMKAMNIPIPEKMLIPITIMGKDITSMQPEQVNPEPMSKAVETPVSTEQRLLKMEKMIEKLAEVKNEQKNGRTKKAN